MRKLTYAMNLSLDGYIAAPGDDLGWSVPSDELFQWSPPLPACSDRNGSKGSSVPCSASLNVESAISPPTISMRFRSGACRRRRRRCRARSYRKRPGTSRR